mmetsp:Transcript_100/g.266  ORF Transcript_100/g.266 Transcript_100/m.266 type:complete len:200 (+) Transcript_100:947-1546(+)
MHGALVGRLEDPAHCFERIQGHCSDAAAAVACQTEGRVCGDSRTGPGVHLGGFASYSRRTKQMDIRIGQQRSLSVRIRDDTRCVRRCLQGRLEGDGHARRDLVQANLRFRRQALYRIGPDATPDDAAVRWCVWTPLQCGRNPLAIAVRLSIHFSMDEAMLERNPRCERINRHYGCLRILLPPAVSVEPGRHRPESCCYV